MLEYLRDYYTLAIGPMEDSAKTKQGGVEKEQESYNTKVV